MANIGKEKREFTTPAPDDVPEPLVMPEREPVKEPEREKVPA